jgi:quercetin dioxygenase-like cupin family protein
MERKCRMKIVRFGCVRFVILASLTVSALGVLNLCAQTGQGTAKAAVADSTQYLFNIDKFKRYKFPTHINDMVIPREKSSFSEVFVVVLEPGQAPPWHKHDDTEQIFYVTEGVGILTIGNTVKQQMNVTPGNIVRVPPATFHSIKAGGNKTLRYLCIDCFGARPGAEPTWDDHVKVMCKTNGWDYNKVVGLKY